MRAFPPAFRHAVATPGGTAWYWLNAKQRRAALGNYAAALGLGPSEPEVARVARRAFQNYGRMVLDFLLMSSLTKEELIKRTDIDGLEHVDAALARGRGVIMALPHMGSWDNTGSYGGALGYPIMAVTGRFPGSLNDAVVKTRERYGLQVLLVGRPAVREIIQALEANRMVGLVCDQEEGPGVEVSFFGRRAIVPGGPAALAIKTGAALLPGYQYMPSAGRHHIHIEPALTWPDGETKENLMQRVVNRFETFIRERPDQWYAFRPMFRDFSGATPGRRASAKERG
ncbi:MAG: phosphatidylinositol dimannoside acyltransferase [Chloroflexota bacterium]|nr:phosphatidylinositol dimannoside acyltransferase [Chloroflexota bacterium]